MNEQRHPHRPDAAAEQADSASASAVSPDDQLAAEGAHFTQAREAKGWSLSDMSSRMKVPVKKLQALETGDADSLPDPTVFTLAMVRKYAKILDIDATPFNQLLCQVRGETLAAPSKPAPAHSSSLGSDRPLPSFERRSTKRNGWLWCTGVVIIAVIALGIWRANQNHRDKSPVLAPLQATSSTGASGQSGNASTASATQAVAPAVPTASAASNPANANGVSAAGTAPVTPVSPAQQAAVSAPTASSPEVTGAAVIVMHTTQDTWIGVRQKDGKPVFSGLLHGGSTQQISGVAPLRITLGNARSIESITLNGQPVEASKYAPPHNDTVVRFTLP